MPNTLEPPTTSTVTELAPAWFEKEDSLWGIAADRKRLALDTERPIGHPMDGNYVFLFRTEPEAFNMLKRDEAEGLVHPGGEVIQLSVEEIFALIKQKGLPLKGILICSYFDSEFRVVKVIRIPEHAK